MCLVSSCVLDYYSATSLSRRRFSGVKIRCIYFRFGVSNGRCPSSLNGSVPFTRFCGEVTSKTRPAASRIGINRFGRCFSRFLGSNGSVLRISLSAKLSNMCGSTYVTHSRLLRRCPSEGVCVMSSLNTSSNCNLLVSALTRLGGDNGDVRRIHSFTRRHGLGIRR